MKLTEEDKSLLHRFCCSNPNMEQVEAATEKTVYTFRGKRIPTKKAIELLGRREYLSGIARSAFHHTALRHTEAGEEVLFDSSNLFK